MLFYWSLSAEFSDPAKESKSAELSFHAADIMHLPDIAVRTNPSVNCGLQSIIMYFKIIFIYLFAIWS